MRFTRSKTLITLATALLIAAVAPSKPVRAQSYPIDCAILLCLAGGWPASEPCAKARAEFIRRITPWPVEPPLQIWRCPMGASFEVDPQRPVGPRLFDALLHKDAYRPRQSRPLHGPDATGLPSAALWPEPAPGTDLVSAELALRLVQDRADIDISGSDFNFVRSIRVYDVRYARQHESGDDGDCNRSALVMLGRYGLQGDFSWQRSSISDLPAAHTGVERWGQYCPGVDHRSVFVDWRDYEGNYGFEQVNY